MSYVSCSGRVLCAEENARYFTSQGGLRHVVFKRSNNNNELLIKREPLVCTRSSTRCTEKQENNI